MDGRGMGATSRRCAASRSEVSRERRCAVRGGALGGRSSLRTNGILPGCPRSGAGASRAHRGVHVHVRGLRGCRRLQRVPRRLPVRRHRALDRGWMAAGRAGRRRVRRVDGPACPHCGRRNVGTLRSLRVVGGRRCLITDEPSQTLTRSAYSEMTTRLLGALASVGSPGARCAGPGRVGYSSPDSRTMGGKTMHESRSRVVTLGPDGGPQHEGVEITIRENARVTLWSTATTAERRAGRSCYGPPQKMRWTLSSASWLGSCAPLPKSGCRACATNATPAGWKATPTS